MSVDLSALRRWAPALLEEVAGDLLATSRELDEAADELGRAARALDDGWDGDASNAAARVVRRQARAAQDLVETFAMGRRVVVAACDTLCAAQAELARADAFAQQHQLTITDRGVAELEAGATPERTEAREALRAKVRGILSAVEEADRLAARALRAALGAGAMSDADEQLIVEDVAVTDIPTHTTPADVAAWWATLSPAAQALMLRQHPDQIGNLDGVPYDVRVSANRTNIANALAQAQTEIADAERRLAAIQAELDLMVDSRQLDEARGAELSAEYTRLQNELTEAREHEEMYDRLLNQPTERYAADGHQYTGTGHQVVLFDPTNGAFAEVVGSLGPNTQNIAVMVPGTGSNFLNMVDPDSSYERCLDFVSAADPQGSLAVISWIGGELPQDLVTDSPQARFAIDLGPKLAAFTQGITNPADVPVTVVGHSYGGSVVGMAEAAGMHVDRVLHVESAGAGPGIGNIDEYAYPDTDRYSMTAPGDLIADFQGKEFLDLGHGCGPDALTDVVRLETGLYEDGDVTSGVLAGTDSHGDVFTVGSTAFNNMLGVMTGGDVSLHVPPDEFYGGADANGIVQYPYPVQDPDYRPPTVDVP